MSGTNPISSYLPLNNTTQTATQYKTGIDGNSVAGQRIAANLLPYGSTGMFVNVSQGHVYSGNVLIEVAAQQSTTIAAPISGSRIDRIVATKSSGAISVVTGTPSSSPSAPAIPSSCVPIAQVLVSSAATALGNSTVTDERDIAQLGQPPIQILNYASDTGSANAYAVAPSPAITAYAVGQTVLLKVANNNTTACTLAVSGLTAQNIKMRDGSNPVANVLTTTGISILIYDGTNFVVQNDPATIPANSIFTNASSAAAYGTTTALSSGQLMGRGSSNLIAVPLDATLLFNGSSNLAVNVGTSSGQIAQVQAGGLLSSTILPATGAVVLLKTVNLSGSSNTLISSALLSTSYSCYKLVAEIVSTGAGCSPGFYFLTSSGGPSVSWNGQLFNIATALSSLLSISPFTVSGGVINTFPSGTFTAEVIIPSSAYNVGTNAPVMGGQYSSTTATPASNWISSFTAQPGQVFISNSTAVAATAALNGSVSLYGVTK